MNAFIPALIAVLLAEVGGRAALLAQLRYRALAASMLGLAIGVAAFGGASLGLTMSGDARALLLGLALILTGCGQFAPAPTDNPPTSLAATVAYVWRSSAPFLAFAFSIWRGLPLGAVAGAIAGVIGVVALHNVAVSSRWLVTIRRLAGGTMAATGVFIAVRALRLVA